MAPTASSALGPALIGVFLNVVFHGALGMQCCIYFNTFHRDPKWMRVMVGVLLLAATVNSVFDIYWVYNVFVTHFMDPSALTAANWILATDPAMVGITATLVQMFFAWRVQSLTGNMWVAWFIRFTALGSICGGIGTAIAIHFIPEFLAFQRFRAIMMVWLISALVCDFTITTALSVYLYRHKTGVPGTDRMIQRVARLTLQNGLILTLCGSANLIAYLATPSGLHLLFNFPLGKLYINCLMSTLNARAASHPLSTARPASEKESGVTVLAKNSSNREAQSKPIVFVHVESHEMTDSDTKHDLEWARPGSSSSTQRESEKAPIEQV